jgi:hypothetical protein
MRTPIFIGAHRNRRERASAPTSDSDRKGYDRSGFLILEADGVRERGNSKSAIPDVGDVGDDAR